MNLIFVQCGWFWGRAGAPGDKKCKFSSGPLSDFSASSAACAVGLKGEKWILLGFIHVDLSCYQKGAKTQSLAASVWEGG